MFASWLNNLSGRLRSLREEQLPLESCRCLGSAALGGREDGRSWGRAGFRFFTGWPAFGGGGDGFRAADLSGSSRFACKDDTAGTTKEVSLCMW